jgi:hypothetical protein
VDSAEVAYAITWFHEARDSDRHIFICGNGGSASIASRCLRHRQVAIISSRNVSASWALTDSLPTQKAYSNDVG